MFKNINLFKLLKKTYVVYKPWSTLARNTAAAERSPATKTLLEGAIADL